MKREEVQSDEEWYVSWYLDELVDAGLVLEYEYQPESYQLTNEVEVPGMRISGKKEVAGIVKLLNAHSYTADFDIYWKSEMSGVLCRSYDDEILQRSGLFMCRKGFAGVLLSTIDVKGAGVNSSSSSAITFPLNQKWVYEKYKVFVQKIIPVIQKRDSKGQKVCSGLFPETFTPDRYLFMNKKKGSRTINYQTRSLKEFLETGGWK